jgi:hypothetical protein
MPAALRSIAALVSLFAAIPVFASAQQAPPAVPPLQPLPPLAPAPPAPAHPPSARLFAAPAGIIFNRIKPDKAAEFEQVLAKLRSALTTSRDPIRKKQGAGWKMYKAAAPFEGNVLYVFVIDPVVADADYSISRILAEAFPAEVQDLYGKFRDAYAGGQTMWNMTPVGKAPE